MAAIQVSKDHLVSPKKWVMKTPTKVVIPAIRVEECQIQPALICISKDQKNIYKLKGEGTSILKNTDQKEVEIDRRLLTRVVSFNLTGEERTIESNNDDAENQDSYGLHEHFAAITARPKRVAIRRVPTKTLKKNNIFRNFSENGIIRRTKKLALRNSSPQSPFPMEKRRLFSYCSDEDVCEVERDLKSLLELESADCEPNKKRFKFDVEN